MLETKLTFNGITLDVWTDPKSGMTTVTNKELSPVHVHCHSKSVLCMAHEHRRTVETIRAAIAIFHPGSPGCTVEEVSK